MQARRAVRSQPWLRVVPPGGGREAAAAPTDEAIIEAVRSGDRVVASALYDRLIGVVDRTLCRVFGRREPDHDDMVQATFEQIVSTLVRRKYAGACGLNTWASTLATHVGLNALRSRRRARRVMEPVGEEPVDTYVAGNGPDPEQHAGSRAAVEKVRAHLADMDPVKAEALFLHDVLGHDLAEISVLTGVTVAAAQSRLVRGRKELHERLARDTAKEGERHG